jgi:ferric-dicitrate binding protein FerR (iron transport regulator)
VLSSSTAAAAAAAALASQAPDSRRAMQKTTLVAVYLAVLWPGIVNIKIAAQPAQAYSTAAGVNCNVLS